MSLNPLSVDTTYTDEESTSEQRDTLSPLDRQLPGWTKIDYDELQFLEVLGRGAYGFVQKALWGEKEVAVKLIQTETERHAFFIEVQQLSRVKHDNIVELYGACIGDRVALVMEYAEGGSLYNLLHNQPHIHFTAAHSVSWALQCARGVEYLHTLKPKPLVHRDLKPPNLLLVDGGRRLKICDFGTACDLATIMTNNKGSAAWMAPEVFQGSTYSEKCDIFSWGIILWEVLTRRKPFEDVGQGPNAAFRIMWAVHTGVRPPRIAKCPTSLEYLMIECWESRTHLRPSMTDIVTRLGAIAHFFDGADVPLSEVPPPTVVGDDGADTVNATITTNNYTLVGTPVPFTMNPRLTPTPFVKEIAYTRSNMSSAPPSMSNSCGDLMSTFTSSQLSDKVVHMTIDDQPAVKKHRRGGSYDTAFLTKEAQSAEGGVTSANVPTNLASKKDKMHLSLVKDYEQQTLTDESSLPSCSSSDASPQMKPSLAYKCLEPHLQPLQPIPGVHESIRLYRKHCEQAALLLQRQEEVALLSKRKRELLEQMSEDIKEQHTSEKLQQEYDQLLTEMNKLEEIRTGLARELEQARCKRRA